MFELPYNKTKSVFKTVMADETLHNIDNDPTNVGTTKVGLLGQCWVSISVRCLGGS